MTKAIKIIMLNFALISVLFPFQNCSNKIQSDSLGSNSSLSVDASTPEIAFIEKTSLYSTRNVTSSFQLGGVSDVEIKSIRCQLGSQPAQDCQNKTIQSTSLTDGDYVLKVTVEMVNGKIVEASRSFRVDGTIPALSISQAPASPTSAQSASFSFTTADNLSGILLTECSIDNSVFENCSSPKTISNLLVGAHNIKIRTQDRAGNVSAMYNYNWVIDLAMPTVTLLSMPAGVTNAQTASFTFSGTDSYECSVDNAAYVVCASPKTYTGLTSAGHNFKVRGKNAANVQSSVVSFNWTVDTVAPVKPTLTSSFSATGNTKSGQFVFSSSDAGSGIKEYQCSLNNLAFALCSSPRIVILNEGSNTFKIRVLDLAANISAESMMTINVDTANPTLSFTQNPATPTTQTTATFAFSSADVGSGIQSTQCSLDNAVYTNCVSPTNLSGLSVAAHKYSVQAKDNAGNSTIITHNWIVNSSTPPPASMAPFVDVTKIPTGDPGVDKLLVFQVPPDKHDLAMLDRNSPKYNVNEYRNWNAIHHYFNDDGKLLYYDAQGKETTTVTDKPVVNEGDARTSCKYSHMKFDDPLVFPGQPGKSHLHAFFGNTKVDAYSTSESLVASGNSTCNGGIGNRSAYWVPAVIDTRTGTPIKPSGGGFYYKHGSISGKEITIFPEGLRMIAGNSTAKTADSNPNKRFKCIGGPNNQNNLYGPGIGLCDKGAELWMEIFFPQCWDGINLDSLDHKSHMAYPYWDEVLKKERCPLSHPRAIQQVTFNIIFPVGQNDDISKWRLSSDNYDSSLPGGYSSHGDYMFGWKKDVIEGLVKCITNEADCHSHLLGDGRYMDGY